MESINYENIDDYHDQGCRINGEDLLMMHLSKKSLVGDRIKYHGMNHPFCGGLYNYGPHSLVRDDIQNI